MKSVLISLLGSVILSGCFATTGGYGGYVVSQPRMVVVQQQSMYPVQQYQQPVAGNPCNSAVAAGSIASDTIIGAVVGGLFAGRRGAQIGAGAGLASGYIGANVQCQQALAWQAANAPRTQCSAQRVMDAQGRVYVTENCTSQENRGGYRNW